MRTARTQDQRHHRPARRGAATRLGRPAGRPRSSGWPEGRGWRSRRARRPSGRPALPRSRRTSANADASWPWNARRPSPAARLAHDLHTDSPLLHWLDAPTATREVAWPAERRAACVFDLDSVLTTSTSVHAAAWADTFDSFLLARAGRQATDSSRSTATASTSPIWRNSLALTAYAASWPAAASAFPRARRTTVPTPRPCTASPSERRRHYSIISPARAWQRTSVPGAISRRRISSASVVPWSLRAPTPSRSSNAPGSPISSTNASTPTRSIRAAAPKPAPDTLIAACRMLGVDPAETADFETTRVGIRAARSAGIGLVVAVEREEHRRRSMLPDPTWSSTTWHSC